MFCIACEHGCYDSVWEQFGALWSIAMDGPLLHGGVITLVD